MEAARAYFLKQLQRVVEALTPNSGYLMGEQFTTADILLTTCLTTAIRDEISLPNICIEYLNKTTARPAIWPPSRRTIRKTRIASPRSCSLPPDEMIA